MMFYRPIKEKGWTRNPKYDSVKTLDNNFWGFTCGVIYPQETQGISVGLYHSFN